MSARTSPSKRPSAQPDDDTPGEAQPAADRRAAEAELGALVAKFSPADARLVASIRRLLRDRLPSAHELVYEYRDCFVISFSPSGHGHEGVFAIRGDKEGVRLYLNAGHDLPDPQGLLQGSGGKVRWIPVQAATVLSKPAVALLMDQAIAANRVPFPTSGRGSVVVRSTAAKKRSATERPPARGPAKARPAKTRKKAPSSK